MHGSDFLVFGGGHAGLAFAIRAAQQGARVTVVERERRAPSIGEIVEPQVELALETLGVAEEFRRQGHLRAAGTCSSWADADPVSRSAVFAPFGGGWFVDRSTFDQLLVARAESLGVKLAVGSERADLTDAGVEVETRAGLCRASFAVEATGRHGSAVADPERMHGDDLVALLTYVPNCSEDREFQIDAVDSGWWYSAELPGNRRILSLMTLARLLPRGKRERDAFWSGALAQCKIIRPLVESNAARLTTAANTGLRRTLSGCRWMAIGDAAAAYDPLHGLGVVAALTKGIAAANLLTGGLPLPHAQSLYEGTERSSHEAYRRKRAALYGAAAARRHRSAFWSCFL